MPPKINHNANKRLFNTQKMFASSTWIYWVLAIVVLVMLFGTCTQPKSSPTKIEYNKSKSRHNAKISKKGNAQRFTSNAANNNQGKKRDAPPVVELYGGNGLIPKNENVNSITGTGCNECKRDLNSKKTDINWANNKADHLVPSCYANQNGGDRVCTLDGKRVHGIYYVDSPPSTGTGASQTGRQIRRSRR